MNNKIIGIAIITVLALGILTFYSFGPGSNLRKSTKVNPASLQTTPTESSVNNKKIALDVYHNKDFTENFYTIQFPHEWQKQSSEAGTYAFTFNGGIAKVETMDVSDNTTLELFVLSQEEPKLKASVSGYKKISYQKITLNGSDAYQLTYTGNVSGQNYQTIRTYIIGKDKAGLITLTSTISQGAGLADLFNSLIQSFHWEQ